MKSTKPLNTAAVAKATDASSEYSAKVTTDAIESARASSLQRMSSDRKEVKSALARIEEKRQEMLSVLEEEQLELVQAMWTPSTMAPSTIGIALVSVVASDGHVMTLDVAHVRPLDTGLGGRIMAAQLDFHIAGSTAPLFIERGEHGWHVDAYRN